jgi:hypothetical protein
MHVRGITALFVTLTMAACADNRSSSENQAPEAGEQAQTAPAAPLAAATPTPAETAPAQAPPSGRLTRASSPSRPAAPAARVAPAPPAAPRVEYRTLTAPAGTALTLELLTPLTTETAQVETPVRARLKQGVSVDGFAVLPAGSELTGVVTEAEGAGRVKGRAHLVFAFTEAAVAGASEKLRTAPLTFDAKATHGKDAAKIGIGAAAGAVIGGLAGGGSGAAKGAAIGGGAGTGLVLATKGDEVKLEAGSELTTTLAEAFEVKIRVK